MTKQASYIGHLFLCTNKYYNRDCLRFCFMHIIQQELNTVVHELNTHRSLELEQVKIAMFQQEYLMSCSSSLKCKVK